MAELKMAFNNQIVINDAYRWPDVEIMNFFRYVRDYPDYYNVESLSRVSLGIVVESLEGLVSQPDRQVLLAAPISVNYQYTPFLLESMFDLVGWIFSVTGTDPAGATWENYYYPLAGLYAIFCRKLIYEETREPQVVQLTCFTQSSIGRIAIGANLDAPPTARKESARVRRANMLVTAQLIAPGEVNVSYVLQASGSKPQRFGHCAETFPFLFVNSLPDVDLDYAAGFAAGTTTAISAQEHAEDQFSLAAMEESLWNPCANCEKLIGSAGLYLNNFRVS